jgi:hypothetical protein
MSVRLSGGGGGLYQASPTLGKRIFAVLSPNHVLSSSSASSRLPASTEHDDVVTSLRLSSGSTVLVTLVQ